MSEAREPGGVAPAWTRAVDRALKLLEVASAVVLLALMALTCIDVAGRELANAPLNGATELTRLALAALVFCALPVASWRDQHIVVDLLDNVFPRALVGWRQLVVNLIAAAALTAVAVRAWKFAGRSVEYGDVTEYLHLPVAPIVYLIASLSALTALLMALNGIRSAMGYPPPPRSADV
ncbi:MAG: TRAP transporter small permease [Alphaproteobacteria bacterium]